ncbi:MAG TPA: winged helix-turn-helix domain-containing protein [Streptosporangiaceae bacterium]|jgi:DNA-binding transcriptional ArsR family regulator
MTDGKNWASRPDPARDLVLDTRTMQALAHPVRMQILSLLRDQGPSTATRLAQQLGLNSGATSYHLRSMAAAGLITEDAGRGNGRDRWWQAAHRSTFYDEADLPPGERQMSAAYLSAVAALYAQRMQRAVDEYPAMPDEWRESCTLSDFRLRLSPAEGRQLLRDLVEVIGRYRSEDDAAAAGTQASPFVLQLQAFPRPGLAPAAGGPQAAGPDEGA